MTVLIAGAGIGGLTLGLTLQSLGLPFQIVESVERLRPLGLGLMVQPQAVREYHAMGLGAELSRLGLRIGRVRYFNDFGQAILDEPRGHAAGYRWPQYAVHRGDLQMMLYRAVLQRAGPDAILTGRALSAVRAGIGGVEITVSNRRMGGECGALSGRLLVGADGVRSRLRGQLFPEASELRWDGTMLWRGVSLAPRIFDGRSMVVIGTAQRKFICFPIAEKPGTGALINWIAVLKRPRPPGEDPDTSWRHTGRAEDFAHRFADWRFDWLDVPGLISGAQHILEYPQVDRDPLRHWSQGPLTLLGDAAHPMHPTGSNGASHAVIDARYLGRALRDNGVNETALAVYDDARRPQANALLLANRAEGPQRVLDVVAERAPWGFDDIEAVMPKGERAALLAAYRRTAGAEVGTLNARPPLIWE